MSECFKWDGGEDQPSKIKGRGFLPNTGGCLPMKVMDCKGKFCKGMLAVVAYFYSTYLILYL